MRTKIRVIKQKPHMRVLVWSGDEGYTNAQNGILNFFSAEWEHFKHLLNCGQRLMPMLNRQQIALERMLTHFMGESFEEDDEECPLCGAFSISECEVDCLVGYLWKMRMECVSTKMLINKTKLVLEEE